MCYPDELVHVVTVRGAGASVDTSSTLTSSTAPSEVESTRTTDGTRGPLEMVAWKAHAKLMAAAMAVSSLGPRCCRGCHVRSRLLRLRRHLRCTQDRRKLFRRTGDLLRARR
jgi:hypothetical protein